MSFFPIFLAGLKKGKDRDVIICQYHPHHLIMFSAILLGLIFKRPVIARADDVYRNMGEKKVGLTLLLTRLINSLNEFLLKYVQIFSVSCIDHKNLILIRNAGKFSLNKVVITPNGFDASDFSILPTRANARESLGITSNEKVLLFIGRFSGEEYGTKILLEAFSRLLKEEPNAILYLVGDKLPLSLQSLLVRLGIDKKTRVYGSILRNEIAKFIVASDICIGPIMPTTAMPLKVLEYMACGKPIVTGKGSVCVDLYPAMTFAESLPEPEALSRTLLRVISDLLLQSTLSLRAKELSRNFSWQYVAGDFENMLNETIKRYSTR